MYDFEESFSISLDEMVLSFRSCLSGLCKLSSVIPPSESEIETIVALGFNSFHLMDEEDRPTSINKEQFLHYCLNTPEVMSWLNYFEDVDEYESQLEAIFPLPSALSLPGFDALHRNAEHECMMHPSLGGAARLEMEKKGAAGTLIARQPWQNTVTALSSARPPPPNLRQPEQVISMEWVYGYNAHCGRQNLYYSSKGFLVYPAAAVCIVQDISTHTQSYFSRHIDTISCLKVNEKEALDAVRTIAASGEAGYRPSIHVWNIDSKVMLSTLIGFHRNGILLLDFSPDGTKLVTMGGDPYHSLALYDWKSRVLLWTSRSGVLAVMDLQFLKEDVIVSSGVNHITFWRKEKNTSSFRRSRGNFGTLGTFIATIIFIRY